MERTDVRCYGYDVASDVRRIILQFLACVLSRARREMFERTDVRCYGQRGVAAAGGSAPGRQPATAHVQTRIALCKTLLHRQQKFVMGVGGNGWAATPKAFGVGDVDWMMTQFRLSKIAKRLNSDQTLLVADHIITPKQSRLEKLRNEVKDFSPQVKQGLIAAAVTLLVAIGGCFAVNSENSRLKAKVHDLELEVLPFRNLAVQQFNRADAESLKKLAESMTTLHKDYSTQLETINSLRTQIEQLKSANEDTARDFSLKIAQQAFIPLSENNEKQFVNELSGFFRRWPGITNIGLITDTTERRRRLWTEQMGKIVSEGKLPVTIKGGMNLDNGRYELVIFYRPEYQKAVEEIASPFAKLVQPPIIISASTNDPYPISIRLMGEPLFNTNGVIRFK